MQGELKSSLNFMTYFRRLWPLKNHYCSSLRGHWAKNKFLQCLKMFRIFAIFSKRVPHYHLGEGILGGSTKNHLPQNHRNFSGPKCLQSKSMWIFFFVFTWFHRPCFSTSNLLWNCCKFYKWNFFSPMHLTCNEFNVHGVAHMKHLPSMSPLHRKNNHCQIGLFLPPTEGPWTLCVSFKLLVIFYHKFPLTHTDIFFLGESTLRCSTFQHMWTLY